MIEVKKRDSKEQKDKCPFSIPSSRSDTWIDHSKPIYDRNGNIIGSYINPNKYWENDRR